MYSTLDKAIGTDHLCQDMSEVGLEDRPLRLRGGLPARGIVMAVRAVLGFFSAEPELLTFMLLDVVSESSYMAILTMINVLNEPGQREQLISPNERYALFNFCY